MNRDTLERLRETVLVPHGDPQLVLYTKLVVGLLWLVHLPLGFLYGAPLPFYLLLGGMMLLDGINLFLSRRSASRARELGSALAFLAGSALLFQKAYVGYFSWFFLLIFSFSRCRSYSLDSMLRPSCANSSDSVAMPSCMTLNVGPSHLMGTACSSL